MYKVTVNEENERSVEMSASEIRVDGKAVEWDLIETGKNRFHVLLNKSSYRCEVLSADAANKLLEIRVNGNIYKVTVKDRFDELLHQLGMDKMAVHKVNSIKAPMPGLVLKILVSDKQPIKEGDSVLILEAMKMENVIKSPGSGTIKTIKVKEHDAVEKNQVLIELG